ncbi:MAG: methionine synthase [Chloroflexi bacterium]|nr:methionine synthase [Chloroflexota bacterium]
MINVFRQPYLDAIKERIIIFDGAMGTSLEAQNLTAEQFGGEEYLGCNDHLNLSSPQAVKKVHRAFLSVGVDVVETNTFRSNRYTLGEYALSDKVHEINLMGAQIARECAAEFSTDRQKKFVAGSMGPTGKLASISEAGTQTMDFDLLKDVFAEQAGALITGGVDLLLLETQQDILEVKAAIHGIRQAFNETATTLPIQVQVTLDTSSRMLLGTHIGAVIAILAGMKIDVLGINCSTGPEAMRPALEILSRECPLPISCLPNAGMPENINGQALYTLPPKDFANILSGYASEFKLSVVGGCCGTTPEHLKRLVDDLKEVKRTKRKVVPVPRLSSAFNPVNMLQEPPPMLIGERLNTQGSRKFKQIILGNDLSKALAIANDQIQNGAHALDLCTALTENELEAATTKHVARLVSGSVDAPLVIDSTDPCVMEAALKAAPGRCLLNSINLEGGEEKARAILSLARDHNSAVIALTIDENGMARTADKKLEVAHRIHALALDEFGLKPGDLVFDPLTFTLASGAAETANAALETLEAIRRIKTELPGTLTCLGVSNISYGLDSAARKVLNSVFLFHAVKAGLDMAILNPAQIQPYTDLSFEERALAEDLIFNRGDDPLGKFIRIFSQKEAEESSHRTDKFAGLDLSQRIYQRILLREREGLEEDLVSFIESGSQPQQTALLLLNTILLPAMKEVGDLFGRGELILPFVLQSAETMRAATQFLERYLEKDQSASLGKIVLATVFGDVHDIGKNLVATILSNNGYEVIDLGKQVPADMIVTRAMEEKASAIGLSALLVSTSQQMRLVVEKLHGIGSQIPVLIGGAAINDDFAHSISLSNGKAYPVYYCQDAFDALEVLGGDSKEKSSQSVPSEVSDVSNPVVLRSGDRKIFPNTEEIPSAPFNGYKTIQIPLEALFERLNRSALYRISWGVRNAQGNKWEKLSGQFDQILEKMQADLIDDPWLSATGLYGYWPCSAENGSLVVYPDHADMEDSGIRFNFPRQPGNERLCLADYFSPLGSGKKDVVAFQIVTLGQASADHVHRLQETAGITEAFYAHGLAVQITEAAASYVHELIRKDLGLEKSRSKRYSWGYPALPDLSQHELLFELLPAEKYLGIHMTSAYQFIPEYTTAAMIVHHPAAAYFRME